MLTAGRGASRATGTAGCWSFTSSSELLLLCRGDCHPMVPAVEEQVTGRAAGELLDAGSGTNCCMGADWHCAGRSAAREQLGKGSSAAVAGTVGAASKLAAMTVPAAVRHQQCLHCLHPMSERKVPAFQERGRETFAMEGIERRRLKHGGGVHQEVELMEE